MRPFEVCNQWSILASGFPSRCERATISRVLDLWVHFFSRLRCNDRPCVGLQDLALGGFGHGKWGGLDGSVALRLFSTGS